MKYSISVFAILVFFSTAGFQNDPDTPMSRYDWDKQMSELSVKRSTLQSRLASTSADIASKSAQLLIRDRDMQNAEIDLYSAAGANRELVSLYRMKFEDFERKMNSGETYDKLKPVYTEIEVSKIKCLPEFYDRYNVIKTKWTEMKPKPKTEIKKTTTTKTTTTPKKKVRKRKTQ